ncbi:hypothetical protein CDD81_5976 [Ophiocordyceps australis]|uniref:Signal recognition particle SRP19 subunit n=1 Tax=Ophiocordyceps australis TaxID=1399860 RepID=A0A2C5YIN9_9HYPO|nr:hypothetical protein CDD81_5976 [Ophiocordyceps australis]
MSRAMVEEASDSEPELAVPDPDDEDIDDFVESDIVRRRREGASVASGQAGLPQRLAQQQQQPRQQPQHPGPSPPQLRQEQFKGFQSLYPVYFDVTRSRAEGRRIAASLAVRDPLARDIAAACSNLGLATLLEQDKTHPKDWANPGRVKVGLAQSNIANKHRLLHLVASHLQRHPTTEQSAGLRVRMPGAPELQPPLGQPYPRPAVPRGWKMGSLVPYLSPAMTGGGVSENLIKDMMKEMQGGADPMAALMAGQQAGAASGTAGAPTKKKKDKKGKGKA